MKITFLVDRPTQFEAPFFRHVAAGEGHELRVLFTDAHAAEPVVDPELGHAVSWGIELLGGFPCAVAPASGRGRGLGTARWLAAELRTAPCDLLIVNGYTRPLYLWGTALARRAGIATALRLDSVAWPGAPAGPRQRARRRAKRLLFGGLLLRLYDLFLGVGTLTLDYLAACGVPAERRGLFPYAVDVDHFRTASRLPPPARTAARQRLGLPPGAKAVLAVAKLNPREAPWDLLGALPALPPEVRLVVAGDGPERARLEQRAEELGAGRTRFLGYVPYAELPALYAACDLFVHPAREERWGVSVAEALACGLPAIASNRVGAAYDLLVEGRNGWRYPVGDSAELARRVVEGLALEPPAVAATSREVLARWDYAASWRHLLDAAGRIVAGSRS